MILKNYTRNMIMYLLSLCTKYKPTILMYHSIDNNKFFFTVATEDFEIQIKNLIKVGHNFKSMEDIYNGNFNNKSIVITFDDGYKDNLTNALPILEKYNIPATIYIATSFIGKTEHNLEILNKDDIKYLDNHKLIEIGSHTHTDLSIMNKTDIYNDIKKGNDILEDITNKEIKHFAYPRGKYNSNSLEVLKDLNMKTATTVKSGFISKNYLELNRMSVDKGKMNFIVNSLTKQGIERYFYR